MREDDLIAYIEVYAKTAERLASGQVLEGETAREGQTGCWLSYPALLRLMVKQAF